MKKAYFGIAVMIVVLVGIVGPIASTFAQDAAPAAEGDAQGTEAKAEEAAAQNLTFAQLIKQGGVTMIPLGLMSVAMFYFIIRNILLLREKQLLRADLRTEIEEKLARRDVAGVREICQANPSLMTSVLDGGLERISESDEDITHVMEAIEEAGNEQMVTFMKPINYLSIIGGTAPMLGLLGTVSGMIKAFQSIAAGGMGKPEVLAGNIGEALITTATGLIIAIPAMIAYFVFKNNFIKSMSSMGRMVGHFMNVYRNAKR
ncbi:MAG: MotA/TolQ/ExbB proton channel family protein [Kiritimatiellales bacterium]|nr:MotA/TolQ/ExbB proton channel family protein [Kiritimatiellales bacterium]